MNDGEPTSTASVSVEVMPVNDVPVTMADDAVTDENAAVTIDVLANDSDVDGDAIAVIGVSDAESCTVVIAKDGDSVTCTPDADFNGTDSFGYSVSDGTDSTTVTVDIAVHPVKDAPVALDNIVRAAEDAPILVDIVANDTDIDGDKLRVSQILGQPTNGSAAVDVETGQIAYTPDENFDGEDSFTYEVTEGELSDTATVAVMVTPVNDLPEAVAGEAATTRTWRCWSAFWSTTRISTATHCAWLRSPNRAAANRTAARPRHRHGPEPLHPLCGFQRCGQLQLHGRRRCRRHRDHDGHRQRCRDQRCAGSRGRHVHRGRGQRSRAARLPRQ